MLQLKLISGARIAIDPVHISAVAERENAGVIQPGCVVTTGGGVSHHVQNDFMATYEAWVAESDDGGEDDGETAGDSIAGGEQGTAADHD